MTIVSCPKCNDKVQVPPKAPSSARVRCPLCQEEYLLGDALAQLPPLLILVDGMPEEVLVAAEVGEAQGGELYAAAAGSDSYLPAMEGVSGAMFENAPSRPAAVTRPQYVATPRPRRKEKSLVGEAVKVVLGGVVGLLAALLILWWGFGRDPFDLGPKVAKYAKWAVPAKLQGEAATGGDESSGNTNGESGEVVKGSGKSGTTNNSAGGFDPDGKLAAALAKNKKKESDGGTSKKQENEDPFTTLEPIVPEPKPGTGEPEVGGLEIGGFDTEPKKTQPTKTQPTKTKPEDPEATPKETVPDSPPPTEPDPADTKPEEPAATGDSELAKSIEAAKAAAKKFDNTSVVEKEARKAAMLTSYAASAELGRVTGGLNMEHADHAALLPAIEECLSVISNDAQKLNAIGSLAAKRLDATEGETGIVVAGKVMSFRALGNLFETTVELVKDKRAVLVISDKNPQDTYKIDDQVVIAGEIIREPKTNLPGYEGDAPIVVKVGHALEIPAEKKPE